MTAPLRVIVELAPVTMTEKRDPIRFDLFECWKAAVVVGAGLTFGIGTAAGIVVGVGHVISAIAKAL